MLVVASNSFALKAASSFLRRAVALASVSLFPGGFAVDNPTLMRFFSLHFMLPFLIAGISMVHLLFLHQTGRRNPLGLNRNFDKISFHPYFSLKDLFGFFIILFIFRRICFFYP